MHAEPQETKWEEAGTAVIKSKYGKKSKIHWQDIR